MPWYNLKKNKMILQVHNMVPYQHPFLIVTWIQSQTLHNVWRHIYLHSTTKLPLNVGLKIPVPSRVDLGIDSQPFRNRVYKTAFWLLIQYENASSLATLIASPPNITWLFNRGSGSVFPYIP